MGRPDGNDRGEPYWRNGREHSSGYQNNEGARANWEQGYRQGTVEEAHAPQRAGALTYPDDEAHFDERSWSGYSSAPAQVPQMREGAGMQRGGWRGEGWGREVYRGGVGTGNHESPFMRERPSNIQASTHGYGGQPRGMPESVEQRGPHAGKGPKGYTRSDERIHEDVCERLTDHHDVDASDIEVSVENGEVTLSGLVTARRDKLMAEHIAEGVGGVIDIHNQVRVRRAGAGAPPSRRVVPPKDTTGS